MTPKTKFLVALLALFVSAGCLGYAAKISVEKAKLKLMGKEVQALVTELKERSENSKQGALSFFTAVISYSDNGVIHTFHRESTRAMPINMGDVFNATCVLGTTLCHVPGVDAPNNVLLAGLLLVGLLLAYLSAEFFGQSTGSPEGGSRVMIIYGVSLLAGLAVFAILYGALNADWAIYAASAAGFAVFFFPVLAAANRG